MHRNLLDLHAGEAFGRYELLLPIARGGMSMVWAARLRGTRGFQKLVAIKTLTTATGDHALFERLLLEEVRLASQIQHPNVAQYLDLGERNGVLFAVMEWIDGEALGSLMRRAARAGGVPLRVSAQVVEQACKGLHAAHELRDADGGALGLVHCDVSPQNLMIGESGAVRLIDFGIAKATRGQAVESVVAGKLAFMAPEQARGESIDRRADVFSLGIVLYLLTTGRHPFPAKTPADMLRRIVKDAPVVAPSVVHPSYPRGLERVVLRALAHDKNCRFVSAAEMLSALTDAYPNRATEPEVGAFVQGVAGEVLAERRSTISAALRAAEARVGEPPAEPLPHARASLTPGSERLLHTVSTDAPLVAESPRAGGKATGRRRGGLLVAGTFVLAALTSAGAVRSGAFTRWSAAVRGHAPTELPSAPAAPSPKSQVDVAAPSRPQTPPDSRATPEDVLIKEPTAPSEPTKTAAARRLRQTPSRCPAGRRSCAKGPASAAAEPATAPTSSDPAAPMPAAAEPERAPGPDPEAPEEPATDAPLGERYGI